MNRERLPRWRMALDHQQRDKQPAVGWIGHHGIPSAVAAQCVSIVTRNDEYDCASTVTVASVGISAKLRIAEYVPCRITHTASVRSRGQLS